MAVDMSYRLGWIDDTIVSRVLAILKQAKLPTAPPESVTVEMFKSIMAVSKLGCSSIPLCFCLSGILILIRMAGRQEGCRWATKANSPERSSRKLRFHRRLRQEGAGRDASFILQVLI